MKPSDRIDEIYNKSAKSWYKKYDNGVLVVDEKHDYKKYPLQELDMVKIIINSIQDYLDEEYARANNKGL